ncbi:MAG: helix-turn-helix transcriptional regulator [Gammaproteobacteria bacterium]|nr:helix-turn-helix transcriptional regulator [Gammaproteobacteria bacterium]
MSSLAVRFGQKLRRMRKQLGHSQEELSLMADIDRSYLGRIERGEANITLETLYKIAGALNCSAEDLLP